MGNEGREKLGIEIEGSEIDGKVNENSGNLSHSGRENFNQAKEIAGKENSGHENENSGKRSHSGRENLSQSNEILGKDKLKLKLNVSQAGHESSGKLKLGQEILGRLSLGSEGSVILGSLGKEILGREKF